MSLSDKEQHQLDLYSERIIDEAIRLDLEPKIVLIGLLTAASSFLETVNLTDTTTGEELKRKTLQHILNGYAIRITQADVVITQADLPN